jgi:hypothetical protein
MVEEAAAMKIICATLPLMHSRFAFFFGYFWYLPTTGGRES